MEKLFEAINVDPSDTGNGSLLMYQSGKNPSTKLRTGGRVPFAIKKVLVVRGMKPTDVRGKHAHITTQEIVVAVQGGCDIEVDDGKRKEIVRIEGWEKSVLLPPQVWRTLTNFAENTILLIIADHEYTEDDYIRNYAKFLEMVSARGQEAQ